MTSKDRVLVVIGPSHQRELAIAIDTGSLTRERSGPIRKKREVAIIKN